MENPATSKSPTRTWTRPLSFRTRPKASRRCVFTALRVQPSGTGASASSLRVVRPAWRARQAFTSVDGVCDGSYNALRGTTVDVADHGLDHSAALLGELLRCSEAAFDAGDDLLEALRAEERPRRDQLAVVLADDVLRCPRLTRGRALVVEHVRRAWPRRVEDVRLRPPGDDDARGIDVVVAGKVVAHHVVLDDVPVEVRRDDALADGVVPARDVPDERQPQAARGDDVRHSRLH